VIGLLKKLKDVVMLSPIDADHHKAENIGEIGWPEIEEHDQQTAGALVRNLNIQNEQRDGDGEHAVAEGLDPIRLPRNRIDDQREALCEVSRSLAFINAERSHLAIVESRLHGLPDATAEHRSAPHRLARARGALPKAEACRVRMMSICLCA
jgi:hypothetical protein